MFIGIKDGKIYDICSCLEWKRDDSIKNEDYLELSMSMGDLVVGDHINSDGSNHMKDSPQRIPEKSKLEELETKINEMDLKIKELEKK